MNESINFDERNREIVEKIIAHDGLKEGPAHVRMSFTATKATKARVELIAELFDISFSKAINFALNVGLSTWEAEIVSSYDEQVS